MSRIGRSVVIIATGFCFFTSYACAVWIGRLAAFCCWAGNGPPVANAGAYRKAADVYLAIAVLFGIFGTVCGVLFFRAIWIGFTKMESPPKGEKVSKR
jgi:hypothetical protein